jgi:cytoskeletal protein CcmA (bactofilin family)
MFGKAKSVGEDWSAARVPPQQRLAIAQPAATLHPSEAISSIGAEMTVVGKIICKGIIKIYGFVEGELSASNAMIADSARIDGNIVAEELTIGGRVKGNICALRVKLRDTAVVEGDIYHRSLSIDENAWFEGWSRPEDNLPEPPSTPEVSSDLPPERQTLFAFDEKGEFKGESSGEEIYPPRRRGTRVFLASSIAAIAIGVVGYFAVRAIDPSWIWRSAESHYTALRPTTREAPYEAPVAQVAPEIVAPKAPATPSLDPEQVQDFRIDDVSSARQADVMRLTSNAIEFSDHTTAGGIDSETALMPFAAWASSHPTQKKFLALFPGYVEPVIGSDAADGTDKATEKPYTEKLYMYVAQARFVLAKAPAAIDLSRYVTLPFLEKIDPAIKHKLISAADATAFKDKAGTGNDNPDRKWCTGPATSICIQSTYKFEGKIPMGIMLVNQLRDSKKVVDHIDFRSGLAVPVPSDLDQVGLQELTGLDTAVTGALEQNIFYVNQIMKFGKFFAVLQAHPSDAGKTVVTAFVALAIKASVLDQKRSFENVPVLHNLVPAQVLMGQSSFNFGSSISAGLPKYARNEIKTVATLLQTQ